MKKIIIILFTLLLASNLYSEECEIRLRVSNSEPFHFNDHSEKWTGIVTEHCEAVLNEAGCEVIYRNPVFFGLSKKSANPVLLAKLQSAFEQQVSNNLSLTLQTQNHDALSRQLP